MPIIALTEFAQIDPSKNAQINTFIGSWFSWYQSISTEVTNPFIYIREYGSPYIEGALETAQKRFFLPHDNETGYWWQGENARLASMTAALLAAYKFQGIYNLDKNFNSQFAISQLDWILGKNPFDVCMMTGVGTTTYPTYLNGAKKPNITGGICNGITSEDGEETNIQWAPYGSGDWMNWRWIEQWLPHDAWFLLAVAHVNYVLDNSILPVDFIKFTIEKSDGKVLGQFTTANEKDLSHFVIEKSVDGKTFTELLTLEPSLS